MSVVGRQADGLQWPESLSKVIVHTLIRLACAGSDSKVYNMEGCFVPESNLDAPCQLLTAEQVPTSGFKIHARHSNHAKS